MTIEEKLDIAMNVLRAIESEHRTMLISRSTYETAAAYNARILVQNYFRNATEASMILSSPLTLTESSIDENQGQNKEDKILGEG